MSDLPVVVLTQTRRYRDVDGGTIPSARYLWRGPASDPVFALENSRDITSTRVDVVCETPCEAICVIERTKTGPGVIPSTMHGFSRWRVQGNGLAMRGFWCRETLDENNEHMEFHANWFAGVWQPFVFEGQQSKHHRLTHNVIERCAIAVTSDSGFHWQGGTIAQAVIAFSPTRVGDPVTIADVGIEACPRLLITAGPTTASQPVLLDNVRYEADQLHPDGDCIVLRHAGALILRGGRYGGGAQPIPYIRAAGVGEQLILGADAGVTFGSFGADQVSPIRVNPGVTLRTGANLYQRADGAAQNVAAMPGWQR